MGRPVSGSSASAAGVRSAGSLSERVLLRLALGEQLGEGGGGAAALGPGCADGAVADGVDAGPEAPLLRAFALQPPHLGACPEEQVEGRVVRDPRRRSAGEVKPLAAASPRTKAAWVVRRVSAGRRAAPAGGSGWRRRRSGRRCARRARCRRRSDRAPEHARILRPGRGRQARARRSVRRGWRAAPAVVADERPSAIGDQAHGA